jgi:MFS family permease
MSSAVLIHRNEPPSTAIDLDEPDRYKWVALSNTTLGVLMATIDSSIVLISLPAIFRGIGLNPLVSSNTTYLLWLLMGYMVVTAVLVVAFGRVGDMFGRVKMYKLGFAVFTGGSLAASVRGDDHGELHGHHHRCLP